MTIEFKEGNAQRGSLFTKLLPEIRRQIFTELFGSSRVHVIFRGSSKVYKRDGHPKAPIPGWCHCVCRKTQATLPHAHSEETQKWCRLATNVLFTCKWAYQSGIGVLHSTNTFMFSGFQDFFMFDICVEHRSYIRAIDLYFSHRHISHLWGELIMVSTMSTEWWTFEIVRMRFIENSRASDVSWYTEESLNKLMKQLKLAMEALLGNLWNWGRCELFLPAEMETAVKMDRASDRNGWGKSHCDFNIKATNAYKGYGPDSGDEYYHKLREPLDQRESPLFAKLNYDIREMIYRELFGRFRLRIYTRVPAWIALRNGGWKHFIYARNPLMPDAAIRERRFLSAGVLFTCKKAYDEGVSILYGSNTFAFATSAKYYYFIRQCPERIFLLRSCEFHCKLCVPGPDLALDFDSFTSALEAFGRPRMKVSLQLRLHPASPSPTSIQNCAERIIKTLERFMSVQQVIGVIILPSGLKEVTRQLVEKHGSRISFAFMEKALE
ncbi:hypothetical protein FSARC_12198 [Fusarium sarcochroum]|uniref:DUF7730 domain-containing protein n=1 Tax=Fusarium sarcochroum TaxID=1208366 RepID=A0A8H4WXA1_9HYPO|nr:hypothetical protein FSARC_12198 [Fusarium sarcochroum]